jgi:hypothetical protein
MQMKFMEVLETLPQEIQEALLELAYEKVVRSKHADAECSYLTGKRGFRIITFTQSLSSPHPTRLAAWKEAYNILTK